MRVSCCRKDCCGFVTGLLSEDTPTGGELARLGWDNFFVDQCLAVGTVKSYGISYFACLRYQQACTAPIASLAQKIFLSNNYQLS